MGGQGQIHRYWEGSGIYRYIGADAEVLGGQARIQKYWEDMGRYSGSGRTGAYKEVLGEQE